MTTIKTIIENGMEKLAKGMYGRAKDYKMNISKFVFSCDDEKKVITVRPDITSLLSEIEEDIEKLPDAVMRGGDKEQIV